MSGDRRKAGGNDVCVCACLSRIGREEKAEGSHGEKAERTSREREREREREIRSERG